MSSKRPSTQHSTSTVGTCKKALRLLLKGNAVAVEWLMSPIVYRGDAAFRAELRALARQIVRREDLRKHYFYQGRIMRERRLANPADVKLKAVLYVLRPALALIWLRDRSTETIAPMNMAQLLAGCDLSQGLRAEIDALLEAKYLSSEMGRGRLPAEIARFIHAQLDTDPPPRASVPPSGREADVLVAE
jgi:predicted nucleotidyltransferase